MKNVLSSSWFRQMLDDILVAEALPKVDDLYVSCATREIPTPGVCRPTVVLPPSYRARMLPPYSS